MSDCTIVTSGHHGCIRTTFISNNCTIWQNNSITCTLKTCNRKYTWLSFLLTILFEVLLNHKNKVTCSSTLKSFYTFPYTSSKYFNPFCSNIKECSWWFATCQLVQIWQLVDSDSYDGWLVEWQFHFTWLVANLHIRLAIGLVCIAMVSSCQDDAYTTIYFKITRWCISTTS